MSYNIISTDEMNKLLDKSIGYLLHKFKSKQAAKHLLDEVSKIYDILKQNPQIYKISDDPFMQRMGYHEVKLAEMDYILIYKVQENNVYILGIFHSLENYDRKIHFLYKNKVYYKTE